MSLTTPEKIEFVVMFLMPIAGLVLAFILLGTLGFKGKLWAPWRYLSYSLIAAGIGSIGNPLFLFVTSKTAIAVFGIAGSFFLLTPIFIILSARKFGKLFHIKLFFTSFLGLSLIACGLFVAEFLISFVYKPVGSLPYIVISTMVAACEIASALSLNKLAPHVQGAVAKPIRTFSHVMILIALSSIQEPISAYVGWSEKITPINPLATSVLVGCYLIGFLALLRPVLQLRSALRTSYQTYEVELSQQPFFQMIQLLIQKYSALIGPSLVVTAARKIQGLNVNEDGSLVRIEESDGRLALISLISSHRELLGDVAYDFAQDATRGVLAQHKDIQFPTREEIA